MVGQRLPPPQGCGGKAAGTPHAEVGPDLEPTSPDVYTYIHITCHPDKEVARCLFSPDAQVNGFAWATRSW